LVDERFCSFFVSPELITDKNVGLENGKDERSPHHQVR